MKISLGDPCILIRHSEEGKIQGLIVLQVDDSLGLGTDCFLLDKKEASGIFTEKGRTKLDMGALYLNGMKICGSKDIIRA